jgi:hypothetical protein
LGTTVIGETTPIHRGRRTGGRRSTAEQAGGRRHRRRWLAAARKAGMKAWAPARAGLLAVV